MIVTTTIRLVVILSNDSSNISDNDSSGRITIIKNRKCFCKKHKTNANSRVKHKTKRPKNNSNWNNDSDNNNFNNCGN